MTTWRHAGVAFLLGLAAADPRTARAEGPGPALARHLARAEFSQAAWAVAVADAASGATLFETNAHKLLKPASNAKLFTAALALDALGPGYTVRTDLVPTRRITRDGVLRGDLVIYGRGDFSFAARFHDGDTARALERITGALRRSGIRRIDGALVADDGYFPGTRFGSSWTWEDLRHYYGAAVSALSVDDNVVDVVFRPGAAAGGPVAFDPQPATTYLRFRTAGLSTGPPGAPPSVLLHRDPASREVHCTGSLPADGEPWKGAVSVPEPALYFVHRLREELEVLGVRVRSGVRHHPGAFEHLPDPATRPPVLTISSPPLSELLTRMMKSSQNLYAQLLLLQAGAHGLGAPAGATPEAAGLAALDVFLRRASIPPSEVLLDEGSGLSRSALVTPAAIVGLLRFMDAHAYRECFVASLPVAGVDGTLRNRLGGTRAAGNLRAKTGTLRYVHTLSGFVTNLAGRRLVFAALLNAYQPPPGGPSGSAAIDEIGRLLAESDDPPPG